MTAKNTATLTKKSRAAVPGSSRREWVAVSSGVWPGTLQRIRGSMATAHLQAPGATRAAKGALAMRAAKEEPEGGLHC